MSFLTSIVRIFSGDNTPKTVIPDEHKTLAAVGAYYTKVKAYIETGESEEAGIADWKSLEPKENNLKFLAYHLLQHKAKERAYYQLGENVDIVESRSRINTIFTASACVVNPAAMRIHWQEMERSGAQKPNISKEVQAHLRAFFQELKDYQWSRASQIMTPEENKPFILPLGKKGNQIAAEILKPFMADLKTAIDEHLILSMTTGKHQNPRRAATLSKIAEINR